MISIFTEKSGKLLRNVSSVDGENMRGRGSVECPADWERMRWDAASRSWVADETIAAEVDARRVDDAYRCQFGEGAKREAHMRKAIEAHLFLALSNSAVAPMLAAEAKASGVSIDELAATVAAKDAEWIDREVGRRVRKTFRPETSSTGDRRA